LNATLRWLPCAAVQHTAHHAAAHALLHILSGIALVCLDLRRNRIEQEDRIVVMFFCCGIRRRYQNIA